MFDSLHLRDWRQFAEVHIQFHDRLTVLTGANGAGKTTLLNLLSQHFGWSWLLLSQPSIDRKGARRYYSGAAEYHELEGLNRVIGVLTYSDGRESTILVPNEVQATFEARIENKARIPGIYLPSHRPAYSYAVVKDIPAEMSAREELFEHYLANLRNFWVSNTRTESPSLRLKRSLISLATFGYGNPAVAPNPEARETFEGFQHILSVVLPEHLGFLNLEVRTPEVVLVTNTGTWALDAASGGVAALIDLAWQTYMQSLIAENEPFVVIIDEPENHLHPALQREVMPKLLRAFPQAQFVVATHNPFVVNSVRDSSVYAMRFDDGHVLADMLDLAEKSGTANDILREVLGVPVQYPVWVEESLENLVQSVDPSEVTADTVRQLRNRLNDLGAGRQFSLALDRMVRRDEETDED